MKLGKIIIFFININLIFDNINLIFDNINRGIDRLSRFRGFCILLIEDKLLLLCGTKVNKHEKTNNLCLLLPDGRSKRIRTGCIDYQGR